MICDLQSREAFNSFLGKARRSNTLQLDHSLEGRNQGFQASLPDTNREKKGVRGGELRCPGKAMADTQHAHRGQTQISKANFE